MNRTNRSLILGLFSLVSVSAQADPALWEEHDLVADGLINGAGKVISATGTVQRDRAGRALVPSCAFDAATAAALGKPELFGGPFRFFVQEGSQDDLVVYHSGGGACWTNNTCGSVFAGSRGTYIPVILGGTDDLDAAKALFDNDVTVNPRFAGATKVFIPYCTGDVGWGNKDTTYSLPTGNPSFPYVSYTVHHHGYANIRAVTEWLKRRFEQTGKPKRVLVAGTSAGGYAAIGTIFPEVTKLLDAGETAISVVGDSANGIVSKDFFSASQASWAFNGTLPSYVRNAIAAGSADSVSARIYLSSILNHPGVRFSQYQNAFDAVQSQFYNIMKNEANPALWTDPAALNAALAEWSTKMRSITAATALSSAYRFYTAAGFEHGVLQLIREPDAALLGFCSDDLATENSGRTLAGPLLAQSWLEDMVYQPGILWQTGDWRNASCATCLVPPLLPPTCAPAP
jgi:pectinacetylesterase